MSDGIYKLIPANLLPNPKVNACMTCEKATWLKQGEVVKAFCKHMFTITYEKNPYLQEEPVNVEVCSENSTHAPNYKED